MHPAIFKVAVMGPDDNIIEISWKEEEHLPNLSEDDLANAVLALSNYSGIFFQEKNFFYNFLFISGGAKEISFMLEGCRVHRSLPHQLSNIYGSTYQVNFPLEQKWGAVNPTRSNLTIDPSIGHARRRILQNEDDRKQRFFVCFF